jgi:hypothetical protein
VQDEEQEAQEARLLRELVGEQIAGFRHRSGSLMTQIRKPAAVKASVIACSGRFQKLIGTVWPPMIQSSVQLQVAK